MWRRGSTTPKKTKKKIWGGGGGGGGGGGRGGGRRERRKAICNCRSEIHALEGEIWEPEEGEEEKTKQVSESNRRFEGKKENRPCVVGETFSSGREMSFIGKEKTWGGTKERFE